MTRSAENVPGWDRDGVLLHSAKQFDCNRTIGELHLLNTVLTSDVYGLKERNQENIAEATFIVLQQSRSWGNWM